MGKWGWGEMGGRGKEEEERNEGKMWLVCKINVKKGIQLKSFTLISIVTGLIYIIFNNE